MFQSTRRLAWLVPIVVLVAVPSHRLSAGPGAEAAPTVLYATLLGGAAGNFDGIADLAVDPQGNAYVTGQTESSDFPIKNALDPAPPLRNQQKAFVAKFAPDGALIFSTFLGSRDNNTSGSVIAVDATGAIYVAGSTGDGFPTKNAFQSTIGSLEDAFIAKLTPDGSAIVFASYLGGNQPERVRDLALDGEHNVYLVGEVSGGKAASVTFPSVNPLQPAYGGGESDLFISVVAADGRALLESTLFDVGLHGTPPLAGDDRAASLTVNSVTREIFVSGGATFAAGSDNEQKELFGLRTQIAPAPAASGIRTQFQGLPLLVWYARQLTDPYSTHLERVEAKLMLEFFGIDPSTLNIPPEVVFAIPTSQAASGIAATPNTQLGTLLFGVCAPIAPAATCDESAAFGVADSSTLTLKVVKSVKFSREFFIDAFTEDLHGNFYIVGDTTSSRLQTIQPIQASLGGSDDLVIAAYGRQSFEPVLITYFGGNGLETPTSIKVDAQGNIYVAGVVTVGTTFPSTPGALQRDIKGRNDGFLVKISPAFP